ncbi:MAG: hypothetical protein OJF49_001815 [Ktedonobacterales bacterium]|nr:MAG: hypothetical protein OJF49_001815 [Ktedonobacterales bacterium]
MGDMTINPFRCVGLGDNPLCQLFTLLYERNTEAVKLPAIIRIQTAFVIYWPAFAIQPDTGLQRG